LIFFADYAARDIDRRLRHQRQAGFFLLHFTMMFLLFELSVIEPPR
jgi:hypothetical protein